MIQKFLRNIIAIKAFVNLEALWIVKEIGSPFCNQIDFEGKGAEIKGNMGINNLIYKSCLVRKAKRVSKKKKATNRDKSK